MITEEILFDFFIFNYYFSSGGHFKQPSETVWAILVEDYRRYIPVKFDDIGPAASGDKMFICRMTDDDDGQLIGSGHYSSPCIEHFVLSEIKYVYVLWELACTFTRFIEAIIYTKTQHMHMHAYDR